MLAQWLQQIPANFTFGLLVGLVLGIASKAALRLLVYAAALVAMFELLHASGAI
jgi:uncharacterized membrane protein (Fun14 family)